MKFSQRSGVTDREEAGLRGLVETVGVERDYIHPDHHWVMHTSDVFSLEGHLLERQHRNPNGLHWSIICRYAYSRITVKEYFNKGAESGEVFSYHYDALGRLDRVILRSGRDVERVVESFQYSSDGTKTQTIYPIPVDNERRVSTFTDSMLHASADAVAIMTTFDASDRPARKVLYDADNRVIRRTIFRYDFRGLLIEEGELVGGCIREDFRNLYRYDASGRKIEADMRWGDFGGQRTSFLYNDRGDVVEERIEHRNLLAGVDFWTQRFRYQYDRFGNWAERISETVRSNGEASLSMIERRDLTYY